MGSLLKRVANTFFALLFAVFSINLTGVMALHNAYAADSGFLAPTTASTDNSYNDWSNNSATNVQTSNDSYTSDDDGDSQGYEDFGLAIPAGSTINGIRVQAEAKSTDSDGCRLGVSLSGDNGDNFSDSKYMNLTSTDTTATLGSTSDDWDEAWTADELSDSNFVVRIQDNDPGNNCTNSATTSVDMLKVAVDYTAPVANPTLTQACGLDIALVLDHSQSIDAGQRTSMKNALNDLVTALTGTPTQFSVTYFGSNSSAGQAFTSNSANVTTAINNLPGGSGQYTNWEAGLNAGQATFAGGTSNPNLMIIATDGDPTASSAGGNDSSQPNAHLAPAVAAADAAKNAGTRVLALGIGSPTVSRLQAISGYTGLNTGNVMTSDVITTNFDQLGAQLATFANQTCGGTITTKKIIDLDGNVQTTNDQTNASGWTFDINGGSNPAATVTAGTGLTPAVSVTPGSGYSVNETQQNGYGLVSASCTGAANNGSQNGNAVTGIQVAANNIVSCTFINTPNKGSITIIKDAQPNDAQDFTFTATGTGLSGFTLDDDGNNANGTSNTKTFNNLNAGTYYVTEQATGGWTFKNLTCSNGMQGAINGATVTINLTQGQNVTCTYVNDKNGTVSGSKYLVNADQSVAGAGAGWTINFVQGNDVRSVVTDANGNYTFNNVIAGVSYTLYETNQIGYTPIYPVSPASITGSLTAGQSSTGNNFGNFQNGSIDGFKWHDANNDAQVGDDEQKLSGWTIELKQNGNVIATDITDGNGYSFENLTPGTYDVCEVQQNGWFQTFPANNGCYTILINLSGESNTGANFGNNQPERVTPQDPTVDTVDLCGTQNDTYEIPQQAGVVYTINGQTVTPGEHNGTGSFWIVAVPASQYYAFTNGAQTEWEIDFNSDKCAYPTQPTWNDVCSTENDSFTVPVTEGVEYKYNGNVVTGTVPATGSVTVTAHTLDGYIFEDDNNSFPYTFTDVKCPVNVTPETPIFTDLCGTQQDTIYIPSGLDNGYKYQVKYGNNGSFNDIAAGTNPGSGKVTIRAVALEQHITLTGTTQWGPVTFKSTKCATPTEPTFINECGTHADKLVIPSVDGVQYQVKKWFIISYWDNVNAGNHSASGTVEVRAVAKNGYVLEGQASWTLDIPTAKCTVTPDVDFVDPCGTSGDKIQVKEADHVNYYKVIFLWIIPVGLQELTPGEHPGNGFVKVIADADPGYHAEDDWFWIHQFSDEKCPQDAVADPTFIDECGVQNDSYTILPGDPVPGVVYYVSVDGGTPVETAPGTTYGATGFVEIFAESANDDFQLIGEDYWAWDFSAATCSDITVEGLCDRAGVVLLLTNSGDTEGTVWVNGTEYVVPGNDSIEVTVPYTLWKADIEVWTSNEQLIYEQSFDCTPGKGSTGTPVNTPLELPQTAGKGANPLVAIATIILSAIAAYGVTFYLVNRRNVTQK